MTDANESHTAPSKKAYIKSFGCQMNVYDTERMHDVLGQQGYTPTQTPEDADLIILNTCHIREKAAEKVYSDIGRLRDMKKQRKGTLIAVAGCVAQAEGAEIMRRAPAVDMVFGPQSYHQLPELIARAKKGQRPVELEFPAADKFDALPVQKKRQQTSAFLTIQEGCDKFCTFCVVPYTRGAEFSRDVTKVLDEAKRLEDQGIAELTLLGQNVNAYHGQGPEGRTWSLADLLVALSEREGIKRLRYTTSHPKDMTDDLILAHGALPKLMPYLHLPVQSGSDRILAAMNRKHTADQYRSIITRVKKQRPDIALSSDFIVGFPSETDADFEDTMTLVREIGFAQCYSFMYSARPGTPAADHDNQISEKQKHERLLRLQALLEEQRQQFHHSLIGKEMDVLFEKPGRYEGQVAGRSPYLVPVQVEGPLSIIGQERKVRMTEVSTNSLFGVLVPNQVV